ncbi:prepilin peptidase [Vogesella indigofera]|uniref:Prepilin leader peptidase/N-methyltransferase n=1 Tax=Vogesella indigofera TaxID=45465 RepID=A0ABT5I7A0_VOGIN|nr:A24 family peptidase [Vogesella indigofera]MDC7692045.1 A24 family peptidase [Vogesella indigofera]
MLALLAELPFGAQVAIAALLGLLLGSFLNVVIYRLPLMLERRWAAECAQWQGNELAAQPPFNLLVPASACPHCKAPIRAWQNIPLVSYLLQRGRCSHCRAAISWRYPLVELASGLLFAGFAWLYGLSPWWLVASLFSVTLLTLALIDARTQLLPDDLTLPLLWAGLLFNLWSGRVPLADAVMGAVLGYLALWSVYWLFKLVTGKEGMGYGDFKLLAALGAWLGWMQLPLVILLSSVLGAVFGILLLLLSKHEKGQTMPFGPYLALAGWCAFVWGPAIMQWYLGA